MTDIKTICPNCAAVHDCCSEVDGDGPPQPGDVTMCIGCGHWAVFDEAMVLQEPDELTAEQLMADNKIVAASLAWIVTRR